MVIHNILKRRMGNQNPYKKLQMTKVNKEEGGRITTHGSSNIEPEARRVEAEVL